MSSPLVLEFHRRPSTAAFMARAFYPSPGLSRARGFPELRARWIGHRVDPAQLATFRELTGLREAGTLPLLYPHVLGFPLLMVVLTHPRFPEPIWRVLQIRNHLLQHHGIAEDATLDLETRVGPARVLDKGAEVDLRTTVTASASVAWESVVTFYFRGRFGEAGLPAPLARAPEVAASVEIARFHLPRGPGWAFGGLTGDYNGIHWSDFYARRFGFRRAFHHPQLVLGRCLAELSRASRRTGTGQGPQRLDAWLKGPVYYDGDVRLRASLQGDDDAAFSLHAEGDERPAIVGRLRSREAVTAIAPDVFDVSDVSDVSDVKVQREQRTQEVS